VILLRIEGTLSKTLPKGCAEVTYTDRLEEVADQLGYRDASGYVSAAESEAGPRDFVWRDLKDKCRVDAAYFRGGVPLVAFVEAESQQEVGTAHRRLWNFGRVPVLIATTPQEATALSCVMPPATEPSAGSPVLRSARTHQPLRKVLQEFTRFNVESGRAAAAHHEQFDRRLGVDYRLLGNLRRLRIRLADSDLNTTDVEQLLVRSIFIRYLEDRDILSQEHMLELGDFQSFVQSLNAGPNEVARLFEALWEHFNGDVFALNNIELHLPPQAINNLFQFFSGTDLRTGEPAPLPYDFGIIPPEFISSIYEQLLADKQRQDAAYYTPRHLVELVLDELVPWQGDATNPSVLDPSCGSGIFLADAFRRFTYRHTIANGQLLSFDSLSALLTGSIYGVDKSPAAIGVAAFSLYLALLERIDPLNAWHDARLPALADRNLIGSDFFDDHVLSDKHFDIVVGNPPWKSALTPAAAAYVSRQKVVLPDRQIALAFLRRATELTVEGGAIGLVLPAKSLLHNRSEPAEATRRWIFNDLNVETVVDLSPLRRETFSAAMGPASIAIVRGYRSERKLPETVHASPRRTPLANLIDGIVLSQDNIRQVPQSLAATSTTVWKAYLWGGPADLDLVTRLRETFPSLESIVRKNGWISGQGFQVRGGDQNDASEIVGMTLLPTSSIDALRLVSIPAETVTDTIMHRPRDPQLYRAPHVIMRKGFSDFPKSVFLNFDAAFTDGLFAVTGPAGDAQELRIISGLLNSSVARYWLFMTSSSWGVEREQIQLNEYLSLPIPHLSGDVQKEILRVVRLAANRRSTEADWRRLLDAVAFRAYGLTRSERDLVRDGLNTRLDEYRSGPDSVAYKPSNAGEFSVYCRLIASELSATGSIQWKAELRDRSGGFAVVACKASGVGLPEPDLQFSLDQLMAMADTPLEGLRSPVAVMQPSVIIVEGTGVYLVKPDERRCWTRSVARSDAAEVLSAILMAPAAREN
jgi:hypothetical protein